MAIDNFVTEAFDRWISTESPPAAIRDIEAGRNADLLWDSVFQSGFADLLIPESEGGAGANLATAGKIVFLCGRHALPLPLGFTIFARAALAKAGIEIPPGAITFAQASRTVGNGLLCLDVPFGAVSDWVLVVMADGQGTLLSTADARKSDVGIYGSLQADLEWTNIAAGRTLRGTPTDFSATAAAIFSALMAGAADRVLELSLQYASERKQFGKPLAAFQIIQQNLALLAEEALAVRIAADQAFSGDRINLLRSAVAKARASKAVPNINSIGHLVHGAIGITEEFNLHLYTRRLAEWRLSFGGERYWSKAIGTRLLSSRRRVLPFLLSIAQNPLTDGQMPAAESIDAA